MKVVNGNLDLIEEIDSSDVIVDKYFNKHTAQPGRRVFLELKKGTSLIIPQNAVIMVIKDPNENLATLSEVSVAEESPGFQSLIIEDSRELSVEGDNAEPQQNGKRDRKRKEQQQQHYQQRRKSHPVNLKDLLTKKGTNRFRPMNEKSVEDILTLVCEQRAEIREWKSTSELMNILENLLYLVEKLRKGEDESQEELLQQIDDFILEEMGALDKIKKLVLPEAAPSTLASAYPDFKDSPTSNRESGRKVKGENEEFTTLVLKVATIQKRRSQTTTAELLDNSLASEDGDQSFESPDLGLKKNKRRKGSQGETILSEDVPEPTLAEDS